MDFEEARYQWKQGAALPHPLEHHSAVTDQSRVCVFGGYVAGSDERAYCQGDKVTDQPSKT